MDSVAFVHVVKYLLLPPALFFIWLAAALVLIPRFHRTAVGMLIGLLVVFYVLSAPFTALRLIGMLESGINAMTPDEIKALNKPGAIVVLGGGRNRNAEEYQDDTVSRFALERTRYAAKVKRLKDLPMIVTGGKFLRSDKPEAFLMKRVLQEDFKVPVEYVEPLARTTWENAFETRKILEKLSVGHVILITHAWHMPRSVLAFRAAGIEVTPLPTGFMRKNDAVFGVAAFLPQEFALEASFLASHELLGYMWYSLKSWFSGSLPPIGATTAPNPAPAVSNNPPPAVTEDAPAQPAN